MDIQEGQYLNGISQKRPTGAVVESVPFDEKRSSFPGLVVLLQDARNALLALKDKKEQPFVQRYKIDSDRGVFCMISYVSILKRTEQGLTYLLQVLDKVETFGYEYIWWDFLVIDMNEPYVQSDFEVAMSWATTSATEIAVCWPTLDDAKFYLNRPW